MKVEGWRWGCLMGRKSDALKLVWGVCYNESLKAWETWVRQSGERSVTTDR